MSTDPLGTSRIVRSPLSLLAACTLALCCPALVWAGKASRFADADSVDFLRPGSGTMCPPPGVRSGLRTVIIERQFSRITIDACDWAPVVNKAVKSKNAILDRVGADVSCSFGDAEIRRAVIWPRDGYAQILEKGGSSDVEIEASDRVEIAGKTFLRQSLLATVTARFDADQPRFRHVAWIHVGLRKLTTFACYGPPRAITAEGPQIEALARSIRIAD
jgi:hypothetical protein